MLKKCNALSTFISLPFVFLNYKIGKKAHLHDRIINNWMTSTLGGGVTEKMTKVDKGGGGVKNCQILDDVICEWSLTVNTIFH